MDAVIAEIFGADGRRVDQPGPRRPDNPGGIVLEGTRDGVTLRWIFSEVGSESFRWRAGETGPDRVAYLRQRFEATRMR